jgi:BirA family transcriptional regulator, biotin operon repressor / biotin---[acetyl-CoA-carboxylase] ligase
MNMLAIKTHSTAAHLNEPAILNWALEKLRQSLEYLLPGLNVELRSSTPSTNTLLMERLRHAAPGEPPCLLVAEQQTQGRGRQGRVWHAERGASLTFSLALPGRLLGVPGLSLAVGVALADALSLWCGDKTGFSMGVKWPNDVWLIDTRSGHGRKLGGVLIETVGMRCAPGAASSTATVIGVGLNIAELSASPDLRSGFACLREVSPNITAPAALHHIALPLVGALLELQADGFMAFAERFAKRDFLLGRWVCAAAAQGWAQGVTSDGALRLGQPDGTVLDLHSGEVIAHTGVSAAKVAEVFCAPGVAAC